MCAKGLSLIGVSTFRTMLNALFDEDISVRRTVEDQLYNNYSIENIILEYQDNLQAIISIKVALKDIIEKYVYTNKNSLSSLNKNLLNKYSNLTKSKSGFRSINGHLNNENFIPNPNSNFLAPCTQRFLIALYTALDQNINLKLIKRDEPKNENNSNYNNYIIAEENYINDDAYSQKYCQEYDDLKHKNEDEMNHNEYDEDDFNNNFI